MKISEIAQWFCILSVSVIIYGAYVAKWLRNKSDRKRVANEVAEPIDYDVLGRAERIAASEPSLFEQYSQNLIALGKFTTFHFTESDMERLVEELRRAGIESRFLFIETLPTGVVTALGPAGYFQIWVEPQDESRARSFLKNKYQKEF